MYPIVTGDFDFNQALPVDTNTAEYDPDDSFVQSMIALRMLSWAGAARFQQASSRDSVVVHACHPGEVATPTLSNFNLDAGLMTPAQAAQVAATLAADQRVEALGPGPFYWNSHIRRRPCEYMEQEEKCDALWALCESTTGMHFQV